MNNEYTKAFFELSKENKNLENIKESFDVFMQHYNDDFKKILLSPKVNNEDKKQLVKNCFKSCEEMFLHFIYVVIDNKRVYMLDDIYSEFNDAILGFNNIVNIDVYSSSNLDEETQEVLIKKLEASYKKTIILNNIIDSTMLGGLKLFHNGVQIDGSLKNQLNMLKANL